MNDDETAHLDDRFLADMAKLDDALAAGLAPDSSSVSEDDPTLEARWERDRACVERLQRLRRPPADRTNSYWLPSGVSLAYSDRDADVAGQCLGRFRLRRELGRGGFGVVFLAYDPTLGRDVALKVPRPEFLLASELRERFLREARAAAGLDHPNLVTVYEAGEIGPIQFISSAYCPGPTLTQELKRRGEPVSFTEAASLLAAVADGVAHAHRHGVIHRDLKPSNILLFPAESAGGPADFKACSPRIADFGLSRQDQESSDATRTGTIMGTPCYMAPEQAHGLRNASGPAVDIYALGAIGYELLTGRPPFRGETDIDTLRQVCADEPVHPQALRPKLPGDLATICLKCLEKEPARRYRSASDLAADLRRFLADEPIVARPISPVARTARLCRRYPVASSLVAALAVTFVVGTAGVIWKWRDAERQRDRAETESADKRTALARAEENLAFYSIVLAERELQANNVFQAERALQDCPVSLRHWEWRYLKRQCHSETLTLRGHARPVVSIGYAADGRFIATLSQDGSTRIWDAADGKLLHVLSVSPFAGGSLAFSPDARWLAAATFQVVGLQVVQRGGSLRVWNVQTGAVVLDQTGFERCLGLAFSSDGGRLSLISANAIRLCEIGEGVEPRVIPLVGGRGRLAAASADGRQLAVASPDGTLQVHDGATGLPGRVVQTHQAAIQALCFNAANGRIFAAGGDRSVKLWNIDTGMEIANYEGHADLVRGLECAADGQRFATLSGNRTLILWDTQTGREVSRLKVPIDRVSGFALRPDGGAIAVAGFADHAIRVWDSESRGTEVRRRPAAIGRGGSWTSNGLLYAVKTAANTITLFDTASWQSRRQISDPDEALWSTQFSRDGRILAVNHRDCRVLIWDISTGDALASFKTVVPTKDAAVSQTVSERRSTPFPILSLVRPNAVLSIGATRVATAAGKSVQLWDLRTGAEWSHFDLSAPPSTLFALDRDEQTLVISEADSVIRLIDGATGRAGCVLRGHTASPLCVAFHPDGQQLASAGRDRTVRIWDRATGLELACFQDLVDPVAYMDFSPDGHRLATADRSGRVKLWDVAAGRELLTLNGVVGSVTGLSFEREGRRLILSGSEGAVFWDASPLESEITPR